MPGVVKSPQGGECRNGTENKLNDNKDDRETRKELNYKNRRETYTYVLKWVNGYEAGGKGVGEDRKEGRREGYKKERRLRRSTTSPWEDAR